MVTRAIHAFPAVFWKTVSPGFMYGVEGNLDRGDVAEKHANKGDVQTSPPEQQCGAHSARQRCWTRLMYWNQSERARKVKGGNTQNGGKRREKKVPMTAEKVPSRR